MINKTVDFLQKNYGWIIAIMSRFSIIFTFGVRVLKYLLGKIIFFYYGIDFDLYELSYDLFFLEVLLSMLFIIIFYLAIYYLYILFVKDRRHKFKNFLICLVLNVILLLYLFLQLDLNKTQVFILIIFLIIIELIGVHSAKDVNNEDSVYDLKKYLKDLGSFLVFTIIFIYVSMGLCEWYNLKMNKEYRIVENDKVIVYISKDDYILLECKIKNNTLKIKKGNYTKVSNVNIKSELIEFDKVYIK